jgi:hypothetical protein
LISAADRLAAFIEERRPLIGDAPPPLPGSEWRTADDGWNLWDRLANDGPAKRWKYFDRLTAAEWKAIKNRNLAEVVSDDLDPRSGSDINKMGPDGGQTTDVAEAIPVSVVEPVPQAQLTLVNPFSPRAKKTGSTRKKKTNVQPVPQRRNARILNDLHPPSIPGHKWKPSGLTGWELYTRAPAISRNGKRSSKHKYVAYYTQDAVRKLYAAREATANARRA